jgi:hypothetical protein
VCDVCMSVYMVYARVGGVSVCVCVCVYVGTVQFTVL